MPKIKKPDPYPDKRIITGGNDVERRLKEIVTKIHEFDQKEADIFKTKTTIRKRAEVRGWRPSSGPQCESYLTKHGTSEELTFIRKLKEEVKIKEYYVFQLIYYKSYVKQYDEYGKQKVKKLSDLYKNEIIENVSTPISQSKTRKVFSAVEDSTGHEKLLMTISNPDYEQDPNYKVLVGLKSELWTAVHVGLHSKSKNELLVKTDESFGKDKVPLSRLQIDIPGRILFAKSCISSKPTPMAPSGGPGGGLDIKCEEKEVKTGKNVEEDPVKTGTGKMAALIGKIFNQNTPEKTGINRSMRVKKRGRSVEISKVKIDKLIKDVKIGKAIHLKITRNATSKTFKTYCQKLKVEFPDVPVIEPTDSPELEFYNLKGHFLPPLHPDSLKADIMPEFRRDENSHGFSALNFDKLQEISENRNRRVGANVEVRKRSRSRSESLQPDAKRPRI